MCLLSTWVYFLNSSHIGEHPLVDSQSIDPRCSLCFIGVCFVTTSWKPVLKISEIKVKDKLIHRCCNSVLRKNGESKNDWGTTDVCGQPVWHHLLTLHLFQHKKTVSCKQLLILAPTCWQMMPEPLFEIYMLYKVLHDAADIQFMSTVILSCKWTQFIWVLHKLRKLLAKFFFTLVV